LPKLIGFNDLHEMVDALSAALDAKSHYTCGHSERVAEISLLIAKEMGLSEEEQKKIHIGAHLHDIGKIGIPDAVLNKTGKLTAVEFAQIQQHPVIGDEIISKIKVFHEVKDIVRFHHERFDGKGYPDGLRGEKIPLKARIVAVADSLDAMTSFRPYRVAYKFEAAFAEIDRCRGRQFDPVVVDVLIQMQSKGRIYASVS
jgi:putative nucleotidyltransferase with HDIG domain